MPYGIIAEYNPFHQGHIHHLEAVKAVAQNDLVVVIVSGWFSQRGLPSVLSPSAKTKLALEYGADIVCGLPSVYACQSADHFALHAMESLKVLGVDAIVFGSETNDLAYLEKLAQAEPIVNPAVSQARNNPALRPNDILGVQYIRSGQRLNIACETIAREESFLSATESRRRFFAGEPVLFQEHLLKEQCWQSYYPYLRLQLLMSGPEVLASYFLVNEGIEHRLKRAAQEESWEGFLNQAVSKTYSKARIQRTCVFILMQITKAEMAQHKSFDQACILGANEKGRAYLKSLESNQIYLRARDFPPFLRRVRAQTHHLVQCITGIDTKEHFIV